ncbi:MAG TPA: hypothetical protein ENN60_00170 [archaeon]|nr:hypothetical protein [archaeon]
MTPTEKWWKTPVTQRFGHKISFEILLGGQENHFMITLQFTGLNNYFFKDGFHGATDALPPVSGFNFNVAGISNQIVTVTVNIRVRNKTSDE